MSEFTPGQFVCIETGALVRRVGSHEEHYVESVQLGMIINESHMWNEPGMDQDQRIHVDYTVLFSGDQRIYYVSSNNIKHPDHARDPERLFQRLKG